MKTKDEADNESDVSNSPTLDTPGDAPATVTDLAATATTTSTVAVTFTAVGDDGNQGQASAYDLRYSTTEITEANWEDATRVPNVPTPAAAGSTESITITGLNANTTYYIALKVEDEVPNSSDLSNVVTAITLPTTSAITDLKGTQHELWDPVTLTWTAPDLNGPASSYDIRFNSDPIYVANSEADWWNAATPIDMSGQPAPAAPGTPESVDIPLAPLPAGQPAYFAIKARNGQGNETALSNSAFGWTIFKPSADTRIVYVSSSEGDDANDGLSPATPEATIAAGHALLRSGYPDWLLLRRGDEWHESFTSNCHPGGRSASEPILIASYGDSNARPLVKTGSEIGFRTTADFVALIGIEFYASTRDPNSPDYDPTVGAVTGVFVVGGSAELGFEDCVFQFYVNGFNLQHVTDITIRRCAILDSYSTDSHSHGIYANRVTNLLLQDNVFDHNGWNEQVAGTEPTMSNHNGYTKQLVNPIVRGNIFSRASSFGFTMSSDYAERYVGPVLENNLFVRNANSFTHGAGATFAIVNSTIRNNVFLDMGRTIAGSPQSYGIDIGSARDVVVEDNIMANKSFGGTSFAIRLPSGTYENITIRNNTIYNWQDGTIIIDATNYDTLSVTDNVIQDTLYQSRLQSHPGPFGDISYANNRYSSNGAASSWFYADGASRDFDGWVGASGEVGATVEQVQFTDPDRTIETYQASLGAEATFQAFIQAARIRSKHSWNQAYTAVNVNDYIREGFTVR